VRLPVGHDRREGVSLSEKQCNFGFGKVFPALSLPEPVPTHVRMIHSLQTAELAHRAVTSNKLHVALPPWLRGLYPCSLRKSHYDYATEQFGQSVNDIDRYLPALSHTGMGYLLSVKAAGIPGVAEAFAAGYQCAAEDDEARFDKV
jgi:hypothetical protein